MKLNEEERQIMVNLEYGKAQSFLAQAERIAAMDLWDVGSEQTILFNIPCSVSTFNKRRA